MIRALILSAALLLTGCTHFAGKRARTNIQQDERVRELVSIANIAYDRIPTEHKTDESRLSGEAIKRTQSIVGLPVVQQDPVVDNLLSSNATLRADARAAWSKQAAQEAEWKAKENEYKRQLEEYGAKYEAERNKSIVKRVWHWALGTLGIGGMIALIIFVPAVLPILGRLLAWIVAKIPSAAGAIGVVSTKAYDATVRGIENAKAEFSKDKTKDPTDVVHDNLAKEMDQSHKDLVRHRKAVVL